MSERDAAVPETLLLNFDLVECKFVELVKTVEGTRHVYNLRDDIPAGVLIPAIGLQKLAGELAILRFDQPDEIDAAFARLEAKTLEIATAIFRHTYPAREAEEAAQVFTHEERERIVLLFFARRFGRSSTPATATAPTLPNAARKTPGPAGRKRSPRR